MTLEDKHVVVLGGTSGIGLAVARAAADAGARISVAARNGDRLTAALATLPAGSRGSTLDLTNEAAIEAYVQDIGVVDHLVYTAGEPLLLGSIGDIDPAAARRFFEVRFWGAYTAARLAARRIPPDGSITFSSGTATLRPSSGQSVLVSAMSAVEGLTRALAAELSPVRVNVVIPDVIRTDLWRDMSEQDRKDFYANVAAALPMGRVGEVEDAAQAYLYAMTQGFSTGQAIVVDGGRLLAR